MELLDLESGAILVSMLQNTEFYRVQVPLLTINTPTPNIIVTCIDTRICVSMFGLAEHYDIVAGGGNIFANLESLHLAINRASSFFILMLHQDCLALKHVLTTLTEQSEEFKEWKSHIAHQPEQNSIPRQRCSVQYLLNYQIDYIMKQYPNKMRHYVGLIHDSDGSLEGVAGKVYLKRIDNFYV